MLLCVSTLFSHTEPANSARLVAFKTKNSIENVNSLQTPVETIKRKSTPRRVRQQLDALITERINNQKLKNNSTTTVLVGPPRPEQTASLTIPPTFEIAGEFHQGSAPVRVDGKWGLIDKTGEWILAPTFTEVGTFNPSGILPVKAGDKYGYINALGTPITDFKFDGVKPFSDGLAAVKVDSQWGYILPDGKWYMKPGFEDAGSFKQGVAPVKFAEGWGYALRRWKEGTNGKKWLLEPLYQRTFEFSEGHGVFQKGNLMGLIDANENILIKPRYLQIKKYSEGMLPVSLRPGKWFYVDNLGHSLTDDTFSAASSFSENLAAVKRKGKWGYINNQNDVVIPFKYDRAYDFHEGVAVVVMGDKRMFIDKQGRALSKHYSDVYRVSEGFAAVKIEDKWGYVFIPPPVESVESETSY